MEVQAQILSADLQGGSMFDFVISFFIINPRYTFEEAFYMFDKIDGKKNRSAKSSQDFDGADETDTNERKPFKFDKLTGRGKGVSVKAQAQLSSDNGDSFKVVVSLLEKKSHSVSMTFQGAPPSWLVGDDKRSKPIFAGSLMMYDVKDLSPPKIY